MSVVQASAKKQAALIGQEGEHGVIEAEMLQAIEPVYRGWNDVGRDLILSGNACRHWNPDLLVGEERRQEGDEGVPRMSRAERRTTCPPRSRSPTV